MVICRVMKWRDNLLTALQLLNVTTRGQLRRKVTRTFVLRDHLMLKRRLSLIYHVAQSDLLLCHAVELPNLQNQCQSL